MNSVGWRSKARALLSLREIQLKADSGRILAVEQQRREEGTNFERPMATYKQRIE